MYLNKYKTPSALAQTGLTVTLDVFKFILLMITKLYKLWLTVTLDVFKWYIYSSYKLS